MQISIKILRLRSKGCISWAFWTWEPSCKAKVIFNAIMPKYAFSQNFSPPHLKIPNDPYPSPRAVICLWSPRFTSWVILPFSFNILLQTLRFCFFPVNQIIFLCSKVLFNSVNSCSLSIWFLIVENSIWCVWAPTSVAFRKLLSYFSYLCLAHVYK